MNATFWEEAKAHLTQDFVLADIIFRYEGECLQSRGDPYSTLVRSIVGQQISVKAAESVWNKLNKIVELIHPEVLLKFKTEDLRSAGLSERKVEYIKDLSEAFLTQRVSPDQWPQMDDEQIISELVSIRGIGRWSAEMFLIFHLLRPDVFPISDLGLLKSISIHYMIKIPNSKSLVQAFQSKSQNAKLLQLSKSWSPYRSVATWYLWRALDPLPVEY